MDRDDIGVKTVFYREGKETDKYEWCVIEMMLLFGLKNKGLIGRLIN